MSSRIPLSRALARRVPAGALAALLAAPGGSAPALPGLPPNATAASESAALPSSPETAVRDTAVRDTVVWDARAAEHLLNRAAFGARHEEVLRAVERGLQATVDALLAPPAIPPDPFFARRVGPRDLARMDKFEMVEGAGDRDQMRAMMQDMRRSDMRQLGAYRHWWVERMLSGVDPLRERMTLFWHGYFTSSHRDVRSSYELIRQIGLLREHALGNFGELLSEISRDPAMLEYLDNASSVRRHPNENFARELFELFTLGEGHYTEEDVQEAARAFTGWTDLDGDFKFRRGRHDFGRKEVLGVEGRLNGTDVIEIVLARDECAAFVARRLLAELEGVEPDPARVERYARVLAEAGYEIATFLRVLFTDPLFYRDEVVGARIAGPVDFLVGHARRLDVEPPGLLLAVGADALGQKLLDPPNVQGWEGGRAWITTSSLMMRGNLAGILLGVLDLQEVLDDWEPEDVAAMGADLGAEMVAGEGTAAGARAARGKGGGFGGLEEVLRRARSVRWTPRYYLSARLERFAARRDEEIVAALCEELLAVEVGPETREWLRMALEDERHDLGLGGRHFREAGDDAELALRRLAHLILSLPEAQLH